MESPQNPKFSNFSQIGPSPKQRSTKAGVVSFSSTGWLAPESFQINEAVNQSNARLRSSQSARNCSSKEIASGRTDQLRLKKIDRKTTEFSLFFLDVSPRKQKRFLTSSTVSPALPYSCLKLKQNDQRRSTATIVQNFLPLNWDPNMAVDHFDVWLLQCLIQLKQDMLHVFTRWFLNDLCLLGTVAGFEPASDPCQIAEY